MSSFYRDVMSLLDALGRRRYLLLVILSVVSSFFQTLGVAALSIFFTILLGGELPKRLQKHADVLTFETLGLIVLAILVLGTMLSAVATYQGIRITWNQYREIAGRLLEKYLDNSYEWHLQRNSAELTNAVMGEAQVVASGVLQNTVLIAVRGSEALFIVMLLVASRPAVAIVSMSLFTAVYGALYFVNRKFIHLQSCVAEQAAIGRYQSAKEAFTGIKSIKVSRLESFFRQSFDRSATTYGRAMANIQAFAQMPKYLVEGMIFGGLVSFVIITHSRHWSADESVPLLALYGAAAVRLLPAVQQVYYSVMTIAGSTASLRRVCDGLNEKACIARVHDITIAQGDILLELDSVSYTYPGAQIPSLANLTLKVARGEKLGIVGATGAGKTTLVDILLGLLQPTEGTMKKAAEDAGHVFCAYVPQHLHFIDDTVAANIALGTAPAERDLEQVRAAAQRAHIHEHISGLPEGYDTVIGEQGTKLSGGQRQRIGIARALYQRPALLVLDEASNALDAQTERNIVGSLLGADLTLLVIAHRISILRDCTRIIVLAKGSIVGEGSFDELVRENELFQRLAKADLGADPV